MLESELSFLHDFYRFDYVHERTMQAVLPAGVITDTLQRLTANVVFLTGGLFGFSKTTKAKHGKQTFVSSQGLTRLKISGRK